MSAADIVASLRTCRHEAAHVVECYLAGLPVLAVNVRQAVQGDEAGHVALDWDTLWADVGLADIPGLMSRVATMMAAGYAETPEGLDVYDMAAAHWPPSWEYAEHSESRRGDLAGLAHCIRLGNLTADDYAAAMARLKHHRADARYDRAVTMVAIALTVVDHLPGEEALALVAATYDGN